MAAPLRGAGQRRIRGDRVAAIDFLDQQVGEVRDELRHRPTGCLHLDRHRDGVLVVLDQEEHRQLEVAGAVHGLPPFAFTRGAITGGDVDDLVPLDRLVLQILDSGIAEPGFGAAHGLEELCSRRARLADDVQLLVAPVGGHLPATGVRVVGGSHPGKQHFRGRHAERQGERAVAVVGIEPVVRRPQRLACGHEHGFVTRARNLKKDLVLALELDLLVVDAPRQEDQPVHIEQIGLGERRRCFRRSDGRSGRAGT